MTDSSDAAPPATLPGPLGRLQRFVAARFNPKAYLGIHLVAGLIVVALGVGVFSGLLGGVLDNDILVKWDVAADAWIHARVTTQGLRIFNWITQVGSPPSMIALGVIVAMVLWRQQRRIALIAWGAAFIGGGVFDAVIKQLVHRTRPVYAAAYLHGHTYSFPSGHSMGSIIGIGMLLYLLGIYWHPSRAMRVALIVAAIAIVILIGVSRLYLGVHFPSDVMGGWAAGAAWAAICMNGCSFALHRHESVSSS